MSTERKPRPPFQSNAEWTSTWVEEERARLARTEALSLEVLQKLREAHGFSGLDFARCRKDLIERKVAEALALYLQNLKEEHGFAQTRKRLGEEIRAYRNAAAGFRGLARNLVRFRRDWPEAFEEYPRALENLADTCLTFLERQERVFSQGGKLRLPRLSRIAAHTNDMVADLYAILYHTTRAMPAYIKQGMLPPILRAFSESYRTVCPPRGFTDPTTRLKRSKGKGAGAMADKSVWVRRFFLFAWDDRYRLDLLLGKREPNRTTPRTSRRFGANLAF